MMQQARHQRGRARGVFAAAAIGAALWGGTFSAAGQITAGDGLKIGQARLPANKPIPERKGAGITEKRGAQAALDARFTNADGSQVRFGEYVDGKRPVVLIFAYFTCPMVCPLVLNAAQDAFRKMDLVLGEEYRAVTVSFDHHDTVDKAREERDLRLFSLPKSDLPPKQRWDVLVGEPDEIRKLASSVGFGFNYLPKAKQFVHGTGIIVLTPKGEVSNYLYGVSFDPKQLRLALLDAGKGKVGSIFDRIVLFCHVYNPQSGSYSLQAFRVMQVAGVVTVAALGSLLGVFFAGERMVRKRRSRCENADAAQGRVSETASQRRRADEGANTQ